MAYTVVRLKLSTLMGNYFKPAEIDAPFEVETYPDLDAFLSLMEERGWSVVATEVYGEVNRMFITFHRPDA